MTVAGFICVTRILFTKVLLTLIPVCDNDLNNILVQDIRVICNNGGEEGTEVAVNILPSRYGKCRLQVKCSRDR